VSCQEPRPYRDGKWAAHSAVADAVSLLRQPPAAQAIAAANRAAIATYAGSAMADPCLRSRLSTLEIPTLVLWGESDGIVDFDYGRAYATAIPMARFQLLTATGHSPQLDTPEQVIDAIWNSADTDFATFTT